MQGASNQPHIQRTGEAGTSSHVSLGAQGTHPSGRSFRILGNLIPTWGQLRESAHIQKYGSAPPRANEAGKRGVTTPEKPTMHSSRKATTKSKATDKQQDVAVRSHNAAAKPLHMSQDSSSASSSKPAKELKEKEPMDAGNLEERNKSDLDSDQLSSSGGDDFFARPYRGQSQNSTPEGLLRLMEEINNGHPPIDMPSDALHDIDFDRISADSGVQLQAQSESTDSVQSKGKQPDDTSLVRPSVLLPDSVDIEKLKEYISNSEKTNLKDVDSIERLLAEICNANKELVEVLIGGHREFSKTENLMELLPALFQNANLSPEQKQNVLAFAVEYLNKGSSIPQSPDKKDALKNALTDLVKLGNRENTNVRSYAEALQFAIDTKLTTTKTGSVAEQMNILAEKLGSGESMTSEEVGSALRLLAECKESKDPQIRMSLQKLGQALAGLDSYDLLAVSPHELFQDLAVIFEQAFLNIQDSEIAIRDTAGPNFEIETKLCEEVSNALARSILECYKKDPANAASQLNKLVEAADLAMKEGNYELGFALLSTVDKPPLGAVVNNLSSKQQKRLEDLREKKRALLAHGSEGYKAQKESRLKKGQKCIPQMAAFKRDVGLSKTEDASVSLDLKPIIQVQAGKKELHTVKESIRQKQASPTNNTAKLLAACLREIEDTERITQEQTKKLIEMGEDTRIGDFLPGYVMDAKQEKLYAARGPVQQKR